MSIIKDVKHHGNHITAILSYNDLIQLAGYTAVEYCGGPAMIFRMGRKDVKEEDAGNEVLNVSQSHENAV